MKLFAPCAEEGRKLHARSCLPPAPIDLKIDGDTNPEQAVLEGVRAAIEANQFTRKIIH